MHNSQYTCTTPQKVAKTKFLTVEHIVASKMGENLLCYKLHLNSQQTSHIVSNHFAL